MAEPILDDPNAQAEAGRIAAIQAERKLRQEAQAERDKLALELETTKSATAAQVADLQAKAKSWDDHLTAQAKARDDASAARLAALPEATRDTVAKLGLDGEKLALLLAAMPAPADPAAPPTPPAAPPVVPGTGRVAGGQQGDGVPANVQAWVDGTDVGSKYRNASPAIKAMAYAKEGPGANAPT